MRQAIVGELGEMWPNPTALQRVFRDADDGEVRPPPLVLIGRYTDEAIQDKRILSISDNGST